MNQEAKMESKTEEGVEAKLERKTGKNIAQLNDSVLDVKVLLFFARARELCSTTETYLSVRSGCTVHDCVARLLTIYSRLEEIRNCIVMALNQEYVQDSAFVKNGDELAIIPPISGGCVLSKTTFLCMKLGALTLKSFNNTHVPLVPSDAQLFMLTFIHALVILCWGCEKLYPDHCQHTRTFNPV